MTTMNYTAELAAGQERFQVRASGGKAPDMTFEAVFWELFAGRKLAPSREEKKMFTRMIRELWRTRDYCLLDSDRKMLTIEQAIKIADSDGSKGFILRRGTQRECYLCKKTFYSPITDEEAAIEFQQTWGRLGVKQKATDVVVCHSCYLKESRKFPHFPRTN